MNLNLKLKCAVSLIGLALLAVAAPRHARAQEETPATVERPLSSAPPGVREFLAAIETGQAKTLLQAWPETRSVDLFGRKLDRLAAQQELKSTGVRALLHWPDLHGKTAPVAPLRMRIVSRHVGEVQVLPQGAPGPVCTLHGLDNEPFRLVSCEAPVAPPP